MGVVIAALPYLSRWLQRTLEMTTVVLAVAVVVNGSGLPVPVLASVALGWGVTALVHLIVGSPLGLPSTDEMRLLLGDLDIVGRGMEPSPDQEWGVGRFVGRVDGWPVIVSFYGRDAADAQFLAKVDPLPLLPRFGSHPHLHPTPTGRARGLSDPDGGAGRCPGGDGAGRRTGRTGPRRACW